MNEQNNNMDAKLPDVTAPVSNESNVSVGQQQNSANVQEQSIPAVENQKIQNDNSTMPSGEDDKKATSPSDNVKVSGTSTEEELTVDATKLEEEVLDEYAIAMDAQKEKQKEKKNTIFILIVFGIIIVFIALLRVIISLIGY